MHPEIIIVPALFITIGFVIWVVVNGSQRRLHLKLATDFNSRLLERIGSVKDLGEFLQTEAGLKFIDRLAVQRAVGRPQDGILRAVQIGTVLLTLGVGLLALSGYFGARSTTFEDYEGLTLVGVIVISLGVGFLLSAAVSYRLGKSLGLFNQFNQLNQFTQDRHCDSALSRE